MLVVALLSAIVILSRVFAMVNPLRTLLELIVAYYVSCLLHECGHSIGCLMVGYRLQSFAVGPVSLASRGRELELRFDWKRLGGGFIRFLPAAGRVRRWHLILIYASGPLANLVILLSLVMQWRLWLQFAPTWYLPLIFMSTSLLLTGLTPCENNWGVSDGARLLTLLERDRAGSLCALVELIFLANLRLPSKFWDSKLVMVASTAGPYAVDRYAGNLLAYHWASARGDREQAAACLESALSVCSGVSAARRAILFRRAALFQRVQRRNIKAALVGRTAQNTRGRLRDHRLCLRSFCHPAIGIRSETPTHIWTPSGLQKGVPGRSIACNYLRNLVGLPRLELGTSCTRNRAMEIDQVAYFQTLEPVDFAAALLKFVDVRFDFRRTFESCRSPASAQPKL
jgi:hypothetical protein